MRKEIQHRCQFEALYNKGNLFVSRDSLVRNLMAMADKAKENGYKDHEDAFTCFAKTLAGLNP